MNLYPLLRVGTIGYVKASSYDFGNWSPRVRIILQF